MDPRENPYTPNAGARPPALVGRDSELEAFDVLLHRLRRGGTEQSLLVTGLRGVGKTVLLGALEEQARASGWVCVDAEITKNDDFGERMGWLARRALLQVAPQERWTERLRGAAAVLKSFHVTYAPEAGTFSAGFDLDADAALATSGRLSDDLTDLFVAIGEAARDQETGVAFLLDEVQFLRATELEALIMALHKTVQRSLPITLVGAGLPQLPRLAGEAKSYAERLFTFPAIGRLEPDEAGEALTRPARELGVGYEPDAVGEIVAFTEGYPYFLQEYGKIVWNAAPAGTSIGVAVTREVRPLVEEKLDGSFFRVRAERTSELELQYLRAMAELGPGPQRTGEVAKRLARTSDQLGPTRARLVDKGLLFTPGHGLTAFTVPQFDRYMRRRFELVVPPVQKRRKPLRPEAPKGR